MKSEENEGTILSAPLNGQKKSSPLSENSFFELYLYNLLTAGAVPRDPRFGCLSVGTTDPVSSRD